MTKKWADVQEEACCLYAQKKTLDEIRQIFDNRGFAASTRAWRKKLNEWNVKRRLGRRPVSVTAKKLRRSDPLASSSKCRPPALDLRVTTETSAGDISSEQLISTTVQAVAAFSKIGEMLDAQFKEQSRLSPDTAHQLHTELLVKFVEQVADRLEALELTVLGHQNREALYRSHFGHLLDWHRHFESVRRPVERCLRSFLKGGCSPYLITKSGKEDSGQATCLISYALSDAEHRGLLELIVQTADIRQFGKPLFRFLTVNLNPHPSGLLRTLIARGVSVDAREDIPSYILNHFPNDIDMEECRFIGLLTSNHNHGSDRICFYGGRPLVTLARSAKTLQSTLSEAISSALSSDKLSGNAREHSGELDTSQHLVHIMSRRIRFGNSSQETHDFEMIQDLFIMAITKRLVLNEGTFSSSELSQLVIRETGRSRLENFLRDDWIWVRLVMERGPLKSKGNARQSQNMEGMISD